MLPQLKALQAILFSMQWRNASPLKISILKHHSLHGKFCQAETEILSESLASSFVKFHPLYQYFQMKVTVNVKMAESVMYLNMH